MNETAELVGRGWHFPLRIGAGGGIALTSLESELDESIRIILGTAPGERRMRPDFGCKIHILVFDSINAVTVTLAKHYVEEAINWWEPRVELTDVDVIAFPSDDSSDRGSNLDRRHGCLEIQVRYRVKATRDERSLVFPFYVIAPDQFALPDAVAP